MKKYTKFIFSLMMAVVLSFGLISCGRMAKEKDDSVAEKVELATATLSEVEFTNADTVEINQESNVYTVSGTIAAMSASQKVAFGVEDVTHVVVLKFTFDTERTLASFEIAGSNIKVYNDTATDENYAGSLSELLDNEDNEDAYAYLILSANTESYNLISKYTDESTSTIEVKIVATLATATEE